MTTTTTEESLSPEFERFARVAEDRGHPCAIVRHGEILMSFRTALLPRAGLSPAPKPPPGGAQTVSGPAENLAGPLDGTIATAGEPGLTFPAMAPPASAGESPFRGDGPAAPNGVVERLEGAEALLSADLVIPKISLRRQCRGDFYLLDALTARGVRLLQGVDVLEACRNKVTALPRLARHGVPIPPTLVVRRPEQLEEVPGLLGPPAWVVKPSMGSQGRDVVLAPSLSELQEAVRRLWEADRHEILLVQPFCRPPGETHWDIRAFVLGDRVLGAMRREAPGHEHRANFSLGGKVGYRQLDARESDLALTAAQALGARMAGVDLIYDRERLLVLEVNANPGWEGIAAAMREAGQDFHSSFLDWLEGSSELS